MNNDSYFWYIFSAYAVTAAGMLSLICTSLRDSRRARRQLEKLKSNGEE